jgi:hypothetical protein
VPLSEFAKRSKGGVANDFGTGVHRTHTGDGRRDQLSAGERTRILRMLRDEGGRQADEDSRVYIGAAPADKAFDFDFDADDSPAPAPAPVSASFQRPDVPAKPAVVVGIAAAQAKARREKRQSAIQPARMPGPPTKPPPMHLPPTNVDAPLHLDASLDSLEENPTSTARGGQQPPPRSKPKTNAPPMPGGARRVPPPFNDEATRQVDENVLASLRDLPRGKPALPKPSTAGKNHFDEPTRMSTIDPRAFDETEHAHQTILDRDLPPATLDDDATRMANVGSLAAMGRNKAPSRVPEPARPAGPKSASRAAAKPPSTSKPNDERTRAVDIRNDASISDVDWDLD